jgi:hypothetical protein
MPYPVMSSALLSLTYNIFPLFLKASSTKPARKLKDSNKISDNGDDEDEDDVEDEEEEESEENEK